MKQVDLVYFKEKLTEEKKLLERELSGVGHVNPDNPSDWEGEPAKMDILEADKNERADRIEEFETNAAIETTLEDRLNETKEALGRIEAGTYGVCEIGGEEIEHDRLMANPAARTCKKHINETIA
ncbi:MAG: hypothetical protein HZC03_01470 [Candidatus Lloydbacteria bacterium]|nr:hypothetical protein [Candidatus Lloydbacteria bacterium]